MILRVGWKIIECEVERPEFIGEDGRVMFEKKRVRKTFFASDEFQVEDFHSKLNDEGMKFLTVSKCQSHQPTLVCVVNESHTVKRHFCKKELKNESPILNFFTWMVDDVVKPTNSLRNEKNDYAFVAHNGSAYDTQFIYKSAHEFLGYRNVNILLHMNRMIE